MKRQLGLGRNLGRGLRGLGARLARGCGVVLLAWYAAAGVQAAAVASHADPVEALLARRAALQQQLQANAFGQPLVLTSREDADSVVGDVYAEMPRPFSLLLELFHSNAALCEVLLLHLNVHACQPSTGPAGDTLNLLIGPKRMDATSLLHRMVYKVHVEMPATSFVRLTLAAATGPMSTRDYRIVIEAAPLPAGGSFVHFAYAYGYGAMGKAAMSVYLATAGRSKTGFTVVGHAADGQPVYVRGSRGAVERNVVRYYLALLAYCSVDGGPGGERTQARLRRWFALTERHAAQLHELDLDEYLYEKRQDLSRRASDAR